MHEHVAILKWPYIGLILDGSKTIESRFTKTPRPPYRCVESGDRIYFKASAGPYMATAIAGRVEYYENLAPRKIASLRKQFNDAIRGEDSYWQAKSNSKFATLIGLRHVKPTATGPSLPRSQGKAWFVLDDPAQPHAFQVILSDGAVRNGYVRVPKAIHQFPPAAYASSGPHGQARSKPVTLLMPDGETARTDIVRGTMFRWRGWKRYFEEFQMQAGDAVHFVQVTPRRYRVSFVEYYHGHRGQDRPTNPGQPSSRANT